jgi:hypothetical protein
VDQRGFEDRPELRGLGWPEFAQFDCYACHHDLRSVNWRQGVQAAGRPGRPRLTAWPAALAGAASLAAGDGGEFGELETSLSAAVVRAPFGDAADLAADARRLAERSDALADALERGEWNPEQRQAAMARILDVCDGTVPTLADYDSARQYAWGFAVLYAESLQASRGEVVKDLFGVNAADGSGMSSRTGVPLLLDLKIGDRVSLAIPGAASREILQIDSGKVLPPIAGYDANAFRESFREIRKRLEENKK